MKSIINLHHTTTPPAPQSAQILSRLRSDFEGDDRYGVLTDRDIACDGGSGPRDIALHRAVAWMLDRRNSTSFLAVLDPEDDMVATLDKDGEVVWESLADFGGAS